LIKQKREDISEIRINIYSSISVIVRIVFPRVSTKYYDVVPENCMTSVDTPLLL